MNIERSRCSFLIYYACSVFNLLEYKELPEFLNVANNTGIRIENSGITIIKREDFFHMGDNFLLFIFLPNNKISVIEDSAFKGIFYFKWEIKNSQLSTCLISRCEQLHDRFRFQAIPRLARRYVEENCLAAVLATKRSAGVTPEVNV